MKIFYRISDNGYDKIKPEFINNEKCLTNFFKHFGNFDIKIIADNVKEETKNILQKYSQERIDFINIGNNGGSFRYIFDLSLNEKDDEIIYFVENDYLHTKNSPLVILDAIDMGFDYITLYDHPDKYLNPSEGGNVFCKNRSEETRVYLGKYCHFKLTNSTTMTFASKVKTLREDKDIILKWTSTDYPYDFQMFNELINTKKRKLISPIPSFSTHGESKWIAPLIKWETE